MSKVRIYEWAKKNNKRSNEIVKMLKEKNHKVRNHTDSIEEEILKNLFPTIEKKVESKIVEKDIKKPVVENTRSEKPKFERSGERPQYNRNNERSQNNRNGDRPQFNRNGERPQFNRNGDRPQFNRNGERPQFNRNGDRPQFNRDNKKPFSPRPGFKPKTEEVSQEQESKKTLNAKKVIHKKKKKVETDRFSWIDNKENDLPMDQKTRTQMKKDARILREKELFNETTVITWSDDMTINKFAQLIDIPANDIIAKLFELGIMSTINQPLDKDSAEILCTDYNVEIVEDESNSAYDFETLIPKYEEKDMVKRAPIVTIMGHVDHGKTTLLDVIRNSNITDKESGGITQHIGAYQIEYKKHKITFLDTPGHAAFSEMRARGASVTDIIILVVAADDGVMPQTKEAIAHAKEANVPLIVAINKMDKPDATPDKVMGELAELGIMAEEWGGDVPFVKISAMKGENIDGLLEYIEMISDMHEYKGIDNVPGYGVVVEAHLDKGKGAVATILLEGGVVKKGDSLIIGHTWGSVRNMVDEYGKVYNKANTSMPIQITGLKDVPLAGDKFLIMKDAKEAQLIGEKRSNIKNMKERNSAHAMSLEELNSKIAEGEIKELPVIIKADVQGSVEALAGSLEKIEVNGVKVRVVYKGVGSINGSDVMLAVTSGAILIGFNTRPDANAKKLIATEKVELLLNSIIYKIIEEIEDSMNGMREIKYREEIIGTARVDEIFKITGVGKVLGCVVTDGKITNKSKIRLIREGIVVYDGDLGQLKRHKDDVKEVIEGMDCGISFKDFNDVSKGDEIEAYILEEEKEA